MQHTLSANQPGVLLCKKSSLKLPRPGRPCVEETGRGNFAGATAGQLQLLESPAAFTLRSLCKLRSQGFGSTWYQWIPCKICSLSCGSTWPPGALASKAPCAAVPPGHPREHPAGRPRTSSPRRLLGPSKSDPPPPHPRRGVPMEL